MDEPADACCDRRRALQQMAGLAVAGAMPALAVATETSPAKRAPQPGDLLALLEDDEPPRNVAPGDLVLNAAPITVYPRDPASGVVRDGSRLNQILLVRLDPATLDDTTRARAAEGIVAYAATCTHTGCTVSAWKQDSRHFVCPCHSSEFNPARTAERVAGPAPRPLPALPLEIRQGKLVVAGAFTAKVGINRS